MTQKDICYILPPFKFLQIKQRLFKRDEHKNLDKIFCPFLCLLRFFFSNSRERSFSDSFDNSWNRHLKCKMQKQANAYY